MSTKRRIVAADANRHTRAILCDVLAHGGYTQVSQAATGSELLGILEQSGNKIVIVSDALPGLPGIDLARKVRAGHDFVPRETSIILTTATPTEALLRLARSAGVDEFVVAPFTAQAVLSRVRSVIERPRPFVDCAVYVGPCRRRRMLQDYKGPRRRAGDAVGTADQSVDWSNESNRSAVRLCIQMLSAHVGCLTAEQRRRIAGVYQVIQQQETRSDQLQDEALGEAARSLGQYLTQLGDHGVPDIDLVSMHVDALHSLTTNQAADGEARSMLTAGLRQVAQRRLAGRAP